MAAAVLEARSVIKVLDDSKAEAKPPMKVVEAGSSLMALLTN